MGSSHAWLHDYSPLASKKFEEGRRALWHKLMTS